MPVLKNQRHELFAQGLAKGKTGDDAYAEAGYTPNRHNASRLKTTETIIARVLELQGNRARLFVLSRQWVIEGLIENAEIAMGRRPVKLGVKGEEKETFVYEAQAANTAFRNAGLELGMFTERREHKIVSEYAGLTDAQLAERIMDAGRRMLALQDDSVIIEHDEGGEDDASDS